MIRTLSGAELDAFLRIRQDSLRLNPESFGASTEEEKSRAATLANLQQKHEEDFILGYWEGEQLVGLLGFVRHTRTKRRHKAFLWGVFVYPEYRGRGIAKALFEECFRRAGRMEGLEKILLTVTNASTAALAFYQKMGFRTYGTEKNSMKWQGNYLDEIFMEKHLNPLTHRK